MNLDLKSADAHDAFKEIIKSVKLEAATNAKLSEDVFKTIAFAQAFGDMEAEYKLLKGTISSVMKEAAAKKGIDKEAKFVYTELGIGVTTILAEGAKCNDLSAASASMRLAARLTAALLRSLITFKTGYVEPVILLGRILEELERDFKNYKIFCSKVVTATWEHYENG